MFLCFFLHWLQRETKRKPTISGVPYLKPHPHVSFRWARAEVEVGNPRKRWLFPGFPSNRFHGNPQNRNTHTHHVLVCIDCAVFLLTPSIIYYLYLLLQQRRSCLAVHGCGERKDKVDIGFGIHFGWDFLNHVAVVFLHCPFRPAHFARVFLLSNFREPAAAFQGYSSPFYQNASIRTLYQNP